jgi:hypothetical protein
VVEDKGGHGEAAGRRATWRALVEGGSGHGGHGRERRGQHAASTTHAGNRYPYP